MKEEEGGGGEGGEGERVHEGKQCVGNVDVWSCRLYSEQITKLTARCVFSSAMSAWCLCTFVFTLDPLLLHSEERLHWNTVLTPTYTTAVISSP